jgi:hypothetical protein
VLRELTAGLPSMILMFTSAPINPIQILTGAEAPVSISELPLIMPVRSYGDVR